MPLGSLHFELHVLIRYQLGTKSKDLYQPYIYGSYGRSFSSLEDTKDRS